MTRPTEDAALPTATLVRSGLLWSLVNNVLLRLGTLAVGIALARLLTPAEFGAYAVALTVQTILMTLADLGLSADLIRSDDPEARAPTVATLGLMTGTTLAVVCASTAAPVSHLLGSPQATSAIVILSLTLALGGLGVVPYAQLQRQFAQRTLFFVASADFVVSTTVTLVLVVADWGVVSLAIGRAAAQTVSVVLQFVLTRRRPCFSWDASVAGSVLRFGVPVACTNLLSWALLSVDYVIVVRVVGPVALGFYVLAFNMSTWPMTAIGQVVRSVALPAFALDRKTSHGGAFRSGLALTGGLAALAGALLGGLADPLVTFVYGDRWASAAPILTALAVFGACRVVFDLMASYLLARGASRSVLWVQLLWCSALVPALVVGARGWGSVGAGWAHVIVAVALVLPAYGVAIHATGVPGRAIVNALLPSLAAGVPTALVAFTLARIVESEWLGVLLGTVAGTLTFVILLGRWLVVRLAALRGRADGDLQVVTRARLGLHGSVS